MTERKRDIPKRVSKEERLVNKFIEKIESGEETTIQRIYSSLQLDSQSKPSKEQIRKFVRQYVKEQKHGRGST